MPLASTLSPVVFSKSSDEWETPQALFDSLNAEFHFEFDAAAQEHNAKCELWSNDSLDLPWAPLTTWVNPPYSMCAEFLEKAVNEANAGAVVVMLIPSRTDTKYFHRHIWAFDGPRSNVEVRFLKGRVKFVSDQLIRKGHSNSAPFPSCIVVFRGAK